MKVLLLNQFFHPDHSAAAQLATDLAEDLAAQGFEVTALASRAAYLGGGKLAARETHRGVKIVRAPCTSLGKRSIGRRLTDYGTFFASATAYALLAGPFDVVLAMSTPPLVASMGGLRRALRGTPFIYWLQDVYPDLAIAYGLLKPRSPAASAFEALSRWTLRRADRVVTIGEAMTAGVLAKGIPASRVCVVPNWADGVQIHPVARERNAFVQRHGLLGKRVVLYSGNMGQAHDLTTVLEAARLLRDRSELAFVFVGDGVRRSEVERAAQELPSIKLLPYQDRASLADSLSAGDVHLVTQDPRSLGLIEPCKLYGVMAAGRPVLYVGPPGAEAARTVEREGIGAVVDNGDAAAVAAAVLRLMTEGERLGARARTAFDREYSRLHRTTRIAEVIREVCARVGEPTHR